MQNDDKNKKAPGIIETIKQVNNREELKKQERFEKQNEKVREEYGKKNAEEKIEVLKVRQGVSDDVSILMSDDIQRNYTFKQKLSNFIYHNKWWLGVTIFLIIIFSFLLYDTLTTVHSDTRVMLLSDNDTLSEHILQIQELFNDNVEDYNNDDIHLTDVVYIPISANMEDNMTSAYGYENSLSNLSTQFQLNECMLVLADSAADELVEPDMSFEDLSAYFPDNKNIDGCKLYLKNTKFAKMIGIDKKDLPDDLYLSLRKITSNLSNEQTSKNNYDHAVATIKSLIRCISE